LRTIVSDDDPLAGSGVDDVGIVRVDRDATGLADADRELAVEQRRPCHAGIAGSPHPAAGGSDIDDALVVGVDWTCGWRIDSPFACNRGNCFGVSIAQRSPCSPLNLIHHRLRKSVSRTIKV